MPKTDAIPDLPFAMDSDDLEMLRRAADHLEHPSLAARLSGVIGTPVEVALQLLPRRWYKRIHATAEAALFKALHAATGSMHREDPIPAAVNFDRLVGAATGAAGGFFGLPGLLVELPVTTTLILRSIADIARSEGEDLRSPDSLRACVEVFALGGRSESDDAAETGYYEVRLALALYVASASAAARQGAAEGAVPWVLGMATAVASRFGVAVSNKMAANLVPIVGAAAAATVNTLFIVHFQDMARHHFAIRRLERKYGADLVQANYSHFCCGNRGPR